MQKFSDVVLDKNGKPVTGLTITVTTYPAGQSATIYGADGGPAVDSVKTDGSGRFAFYAANGHYTVTVSGTGITPVVYNDVTLYDPSDDTVYAEVDALQAKQAQVVSVKDFPGDDTTAFQAAINFVYAAGGGTVTVPPGTYNIAALSMKSGVTVKCAEGAIINGEGYAAGDLIQFYGTVGAEYAFTAAATRGDTVIQLGGSPGFAVGDVVHLVSYLSAFAPGSYNLGYHATDACYFTEWNIIAADLGGGKYRLAIPLIFPGWSTSSKAKKVTPCKDAHWIGGTINRATSGTSSDAIFDGNWAYRCTVRDVLTNRGSRSGVTLQWMKSWLCEGSNIVDPNDPSHLFNYSLEHAAFNRFRTVGSQDCGFVRLHPSFGGQTVDFTYSNSTAPYSNVRSYCRDGIFHRCYEGLTSHQGCYQEQWIGNTITDCYDDGIVVRGYMPTIKNNIITSTVDVTDSLVITAGSFVVGREYTITSVGTTDFTLIGASANANGTTFVATGAGTGTGTATQADTYGIRLAYGGARRADISGNVIRGFYGAFSVYGSPSLGQWTSMLANIHDNEVSHCFIGMTVDTYIGNTNDMRYLTYKGNRHSEMGRYVVYFPGYMAGSTIQGNVLDGAFRYTGAGTDVAFVQADANCPALTITENTWNRPKGANAGKTSRFVNIGNVTDTAMFPQADWAAQTVLRNNKASFDADAGYVHQTVVRLSYYQEAFVEGPDSNMVIAGGIVYAGPSNSRIFYVNLDTEASAATDDLDQLQPYTNCSFREGDVAYLRTVANARDVVIRDISTSAAASNGFQTPANASITLGTSNDIVSCIHNGTHWCVASQSLNG